MRMPWGKFEGKMIYEVPNDYLDWLLEHEQENHKTFTDKLFFDAVRKEMRERKGSGYYIPAE